MTKHIEETCPRCHGFVWKRRKPCNCEPFRIVHYNNPQMLGVIGERLKAIREGKGLSLDALAKRAQMSKTGLWEIEAGRNEPRAFTLVALSEALEVSVDYLLCREKFR
jgi:DNA-binding XRE family transcriptional regulator